jgi:hypothetical protein
MNSPNLHEIWVLFFLNLSQELKLVLLLYFGTLGDGYSLKGSKKIAFAAQRGRRGEGERKRGEGERNGTDVSQ